MEDLLTDYYKFDPDYQEIFQMLQKYHREEELMQLIKKNDYHGLYQFAIEYGLERIFIYIYQEVKVPFDSSLLNKFFVSLGVDPEDESLRAPVQTGTSNQSGLTIQVHDKFSAGRQNIARYFHENKKYSKYTAGNGKFIYTYNRKL